MSPQIKILYHMKQTKKQQNENLKKRNLGMILECSKRFLKKE